MTINGWTVYPVLNGWQWGYHSPGDVMVGRCSTKKQAVYWCVRGIINRAVAEAQDD